MTLRACGECRRHFGDESVCPFCGTVAPPRQSRPVPSGRMSRAAAFAALTGCYTSNPPPQQAYEPPPPPPPHEHQQQQQQQQQFADPPPPPPPPPPQAVTGTSRIEGSVLDMATNGPAASVTVQLHALGNAGFASRMTRTDAMGRYAFVDLPAGRYRVTLTSNHPRRQPPQRMVTLTDNATQVADLQVPAYVPSPIPTPYGAPPARIRIV